MLLLLHLYIYIYFQCYMHILSHIYIYIRIYICIWLYRIIVYYTKLFTYIFIMNCLSCELLINDIESKSSSGAIKCSKCLKCIHYKCLYANTDLPTQWNNNGPSNISIGIMCSPCFLYICTQYRNQPLHSTTESTLYLLKLNTSQQYWMTTLITSSQPYKCNQFTV